MEPAEFDKFADEYESFHRQSIAVSGEPPECFARYNIDVLARVVESLGVSVRRILDFGSGIGNSVPHFRALFTHSQLTCSDVSERSLALAEKRYPGLAQSLRI